MKAPSGACLDRENLGGYAGLAIIIVLAALTTTALLLAPNLVKSRVQARQFDETRRLEIIADQLVRSIRSQQYIPSPTNWTVTLAEFTGLSRTAIEQVYPEFPSDTSTRRVLLLDPAIGKGTLPYTQGLAGLEGAFTNLAGAGSRGLIISSTRRGWSLPVSSGLASSTAEFDAIWNWNFDPATKASPSGWPSAWKGFGEELHVARINFGNLFHTVRMNNLLLVVETNRVSLPIQAKADLSALKELLGELKGPFEQVIQPITTPTEIKVLDGTLLKIYETNGSFAQARRITSDAVYEFETTNSGPPVVHFKFLEVKGAVATNSGSYGSAWDAIYTNGVTLGVNEPAPPTFPSFPTNNTSVYFDGNKSYVETGKKLTNVLTAFTLAAWIRPEQAAKNTIYIAGIRNSLSLNIYTARKTGFTVIRISTKRGSNLAKAYPYSLKEWHHVTAVGTGSRLQLYFDGMLVAQKSFSTPNYFYDNGYTFRIGANPQLRRGVTSWGFSQQYQGGIDELVFYDRAVTTNEVLKIASGVIP